MWIKTDLDRQCLHYASRGLHLNKRLLPVIDVTEHTGEKTATSQTPFAIFVAARGTSSKPVFQKKAKTGPFSRQGHGKAQADLLDGIATEAYKLYNLSSNEPSILVDIMINEQPTQMEVYSGACFLSSAKEQ